MATTRTPAPRKRKPAPKSKSTTGAAPRKRKPPARKGSSTRTRAKRSSATWAPRIPVIEQRHLDLFGLALVACGVFLAFPLYAGWDGGQAGDGVIDGLALAIGRLRYVAPVGIIAAGAIIVMRPVLPSVRPFRSGGICFTLALALMTFVFTHVEGIRWNGPTRYFKSWIPEAPKPLLALIVPLEVLGQFMRLISLSVRLFANMLAGHILILTFIGLLFILQNIFLAVVVVPVAAVFYLFEVVIVVSIQAFIFAALSAIYIGSAIEPEH